MFIQNRAKSIAQKLNAKNIAPLNRRIYDLRDKIAESRLDSATLRIKIDDVISVEMVDSAESQNLAVKNNSVRSTQTRPLRGAKNRIQASSSASADFLLEAEKRGSPPKSEKAAAFWRVGGAGRGVQPFLREKTRELNSQKSDDFAESSLDSAILACNDESFLDSANNALGDLESLLKDLKPWRKGPFNICGIEVQSEWDSAIKFNIIAPHLSVEGKVVADIGCNNGYYAFRLLPLRPSKIVGFEPSAHCKAQFDLIDSFIQSEIRFEVLGVEDLADYDCKFDCILCLGVIYHRTNPIDCLKIIRGALNPRGELIIDTLIIESEDEMVLSPLSYAKMKNVYFIPSISAFKNWLVRVGFKEIELLCVKKTTSDEQRKTAWSGGESLEDFLDKDDKNKTIEGYSAPIRAYFKAKV